MKKGVGISVLIMVLTVLIVVDIIGGLIVVGGIKQLQLLHLKV